MVDRTGQVWRFHNGDFGFKVLKKFSEDMWLVLNVSGAEVSIDEYWITTQRMYFLDKTSLKNSTVLRSW